MQYYYILDQNVRDLAGTFRKTIKSTISIRVTKRTATLQFQLYPYEVADSKLIHLQYHI